MFVKIPGFNVTTYRNGDALTGRQLLTDPSDPHKQPHEVDEYVLRGPEIVFHDGRGEVSLGYMDFLPSTLRQVAHETLGMRHEHEFQEVERALDKAQRAENAAIEARNAARDLAQGALIELAELREALTEREADLQVALQRAEAAEAALAEAPKASARPRKAAQS